MEQISLGLAIRALREKKQISSKDLSILADLPDYTISRLENGKVRLDFVTALKITSALGVTMDELVEAAKGFSSTPVVEKEAELNEIKAQLRALKAALMEKANSLN